MTTKQTWVGLLSGALVVAGFMAAASGCKMLKKETEETAADTATAEPEPPPEAEPTAEASSEASAEASADAAAGDAGEEIGDDEVKTYPNQIPASGTYILYKSFKIYQAADTESKELGGVGRGTIIELKATLGEWLLIDWPAGPGEMKPGWIKVRLQQTNYIKKSTKPVDAGVKKEPEPAPTQTKRGKPFYYKKPKK